MFFLSEYLNIRFFVYVRVCRKTETRSQTSSCCSKSKVAIALSASYFPRLVIRVAAGRIYRRAQALRRDDRLQLEVFLQVADPGPEFCRCEPSFCCSKSAIGADRFCSGCKVPLLKVGVRTCTLYTTSGRGCFLPRRKSRERRT